MSTAADNSEAGARSWSGKRPYLKDKCTVTEQELELLNEQAIAGDSRAVAALTALLSSADADERDYAAIALSELIDVDGLSAEQVAAVYAADWTGLDVRYEHKWLADAVRRFEKRRADEDEPINPRDKWERADYHADER